MTRHNPSVFDPVPAPSPDDAPSEPTEGPAWSTHGPLIVVREWADALIIAFILAMFVRVFMVELFKIPSGSMTPTLIGGRVAHVDYNQDGKRDLILIRDGQAPLGFLGNGRRFVADGQVTLTADDLERMTQDGTMRLQYDRILVNKLTYWFRLPRRGEVTVFKVPPHIWNQDKPIFIKRCVGGPGDQLTFDGPGHLMANGRRVERPEFFQTQTYDLKVPYRDVKGRPDIQYKRMGGQAELRRIDVPPDQVYVFGDNTDSSLDSRYWGGVPLTHVKGRAFLRYWPLMQMKFL